MICDRASVGTNWDHLGRGAENHMHFDSIATVRFWAHEARTRPDVRCDQMCAATRVRMNAVIAATSSRAAFIFQIVVESGRPLTCSDSRTRGRRAMLPTVLHFGVASKGQPLLQSNLHAHSSMFAEVDMRSRCSEGHLSCRPDGRARSRLPASNTLTTL